MVGEDRDNSGEVFIENFRGHLGQIDEVANVILRGHLEVEGHLDDVVDLIFFRPEHLRKIRLGFYQKVQIAKAYCPDPNARDWIVIDCLKEARNSIAHKGAPEMRAAKIAKLRESMSGYGTEAFQNELKVADQKEIVVLAAALCSGFLSYLEDSVRQVREAIAQSLEVPMPPRLREDS